VASILLENGFSKVTPILGGIAAWKEAGYPIEP
jgi:rhodanese-related sulfurtransferase